MGAKESVTDYLAEALKDTGYEQFTRGEVAVLMATAFRWGMEKAADEANGEWAEDDPIWVAGERIEGSELGLRRRPFRERVFRRDQLDRMERLARTDEERDRIIAERQQGRP